MRVFAVFRLVCKTSGCVRAKNAPRDKVSKRAYARGRVRPHIASPKMDHMEVDAPAGEVQIHQHRPEPRVTKFSILFHRVGLKDGKKVLPAATVIERQCQSHPCYSALVEICSRQSATVLLELLNHYCVRSTLAVHEAGAAYEGCKRTHPCVHADLRLFEHTGDPMCNDAEGHIEICVDNVGDALALVYQSALEKLVAAATGYTPTTKRAGS